MRGGSLQAHRFCKFVIMKFKIPNIKITSVKKNTAEVAAPADDANDVLNELENGNLDGYTEHAEAAPVSPAFTVREDQLRKLWAGEIAFGLIASLAAVIIAFVG